MHVLELIYIYVYIYMHICVYIYIYLCVYVYYIHYTTIQVYPYLVIPYSMQVNSPLSSWGVSSQRPGHEVHQ